MKTSTLTVLLTLAAAVQGTETTSLGRPTLKPVARRLPLFGGFARLFGNNKVAVTDSSHSEEKEAAAFERPNTPATVQSSPASYRRKHRREQNVVAVADFPPLPNVETIKPPSLDAEIELVDEFADGRDVEGFNLLYRLNIKNMKKGRGQISTAWAYHLAKTGELNDFCRLGWGPDLDILMRRRLYEYFNLCNKFNECCDELKELRDKVIQKKSAKSSDSIDQKKSANSSDSIDQKKSTMSSDPELQVSSDNNEAVQNVENEFWATYNLLMHKHEIIRQRLPIYKRAWYVINAIDQCHRMPRRANENSAGNDADNDQSQIK